MTLEIPTQSEGLWTPGPAFATPGDFVAQNVTRAGLWRRTGRWVRIWGYLAFDANAYTTAAGTFYVDGLPFAAAADLPLWPIGLGDFRMVTLGTTPRDIAARITAGESRLHFRSTLDASAGAAFSATGLPASRTGFVISVSGEYRAA